MATGVVWQTGLAITDGPKFRAWDMSTGGVAFPTPEWLVEDPAIGGAGWDRPTASDDRRFVAYCTNASNSIFVYDLLKQSRLRILLPSDSNGIDPPIVSPSGRWVAVSRYEDTETQPIVHVFDAATGKEVTIPAFTQWCNFLAWSPDESRLAIGTATGLAVLNTSTWTTISLGTAFSGDSSAGVFSPTGAHFVLVRYDDFGCRLYETATWTSTTLTYPTGEQYTPSNDAKVCFSPNGERFLLRPGKSDISRTYVFAIPSGTVTHDLSHAALTGGNHSQEIKAVEFLPNSDSLVHAGYTYNADISSSVIRLHEYNLATNTYAGFVDATDRLDPGIDTPTIKVWISTLPPIGVTTGATGGVLTADNSPAVGTEVRVHDRITGAVLGTAETDGSGQFTVGPVIPYTPEIQVVLKDDSVPALNDLIYRINV
jgi:hypothetical protein